MGSAVDPSALGHTRHPNDASGRALPTPTRSHLGCRCSASFEGDRRGAGKHRILIAAACRDNGMQDLIAALNVIRTPAECRRSARRRAATENTNAIVRGVRSGRSPRGRTSPAVGAPEGCCFSRRGSGDVDLRASLLHACSGHLLLIAAPHPQQQRRLTYGWPLSARMSRLATELYLPGVAAVQPGRSRRLGLNCTSAEHWGRPRGRVPTSSVEALVYGPWRRL